MNYLFLSPHPDDVELTCGASIARLISEGHEIAIAVFSNCDIDMDETRQSHKILGAKTIEYNFPRREFESSRQAILDELIVLRNMIRPDVVFLPDRSDIHQDHQVIGREGIRAFKMDADIISYAHAHNQLECVSNYFIMINTDHVLTKLRSLEAYKSQHSRFYFKQESVIAVMRYHGTQCGAELAEAFRIIKQLK